jgi:hypothetical protein
MMDSTIAITMMIMIMMMMLIMVGEDSGSHLRRFTIE